MIVVGNYLVDATYEELIESLKLKAIEYDVELFSREKILASGNYMASCPFHKHGKERKPSFGINLNTGLCNCFTCGWRGNFMQLIEQVFEDIGEVHLKARKWLLHQFHVIALGNNKNSLSTPRIEKYEHKKPKVYVSERELKKYRYTHPYVYKRGLTDEIIEMFDVGYDHDTNCVTFPVLDLDGNCVFVARRSVKTKYFNYPKDVEKPVYGAYLFTSGKYMECVICESIFNCLTCWKHNKPAVALLGLGSKNQYEILKKLPVRKYIVATDPDVRGYNAGERLRKELSATKLITYLDLPDGKDVNDCDEFFNSLVEIF